MPFPTTPLKHPTPLPPIGNSPRDEERIAIPLSTTLERWHSLCSYKEFTSQPLERKATSLGLNGTVENDRQGMILKSLSLKNSIRQGLIMALPTQPTYKQKSASPYQPISHMPLFVRSI